MIEHKHDHKKFHGIDGCKAGWCIATVDSEQLTLNIVRDISTVFNSKEDSMTFVDMPIGLQDDLIERDVEVFARKLLHKKQKASLFTPPVLEAIYADNYQHANSINQRISGKKISIQSWNISSKIKELNELLTQKPHLTSIIKESHPEICFKFLNNGIDLKFRKHEPFQKGIIERLGIMTNYFPQATNSYNVARSQYSSTDVKNDDIVDAMCLALVARIGYHYGYQVIRGTNKYNTQGIEMSISYHHPKYPVRCSI